MKNLLAHIKTIVKHAPSRPIHKSFLSLHNQRKFCYPLPITNDKGTKMLTGPEKSRVKKFTAGMDESTANAMLNLFILTKPGCDAAASDLMMAAHGHYPRVCTGTISAYRPYVLVGTDGSIPAPVKLAIRKAIAQNYLVMHGPNIPTPKPNLAELNYR